MPKGFFSAPSVIPKLLALLLFSLFLEVSTGTVSAQKLRSHSNEAFGEDEFLRLRVYYTSMFTGSVTAGEATIQVTTAKRKFFGREVWHIVAEGRSKGAFNWFFKVRN
ncbi:MAG: DUF3108 domain-containing protein, partial [Bacteroidetes bacterium]|nr:DUF3108 domain-containing protein [Bacteroidota bacterium]